MLRNREIAENWIAVETNRYDQLSTYASPEKMLKVSFQSLSSVYVPIFHVVRMPNVTLSHEMGIKSMRPERASGKYVSYDHYILSSI